MLHHNEFAEYEQQDPVNPPHMDLEKSDPSKQMHDEEIHYRVPDDLQHNDDFEDVGLPPNADDYFETNPNDLSYAYENTARDMMIEEALVTDF